MSDLLRVYSVYLKKVIDSELKPSIDELRNIINTELRPNISSLETITNEQQTFKDALTKNLQVEQITINENGEEVREILYGTLPLSVVSIDISNATSFEGTDGNINIKLANGKPDYHFKLYANDGTLKEEITKSFLEHTFYNLPADTYYIIVEDSDEPQKTLTHTNLVLTQPSPPPQGLFGPYSLGVNDKFNLREEFFQNLSQNTFSFIYIVQGEAYTKFAYTNSNWTTFRFIANSDYIAVYLFGSYPFSFSDNTFSIPNEAYKIWVYNHTLNKVFLYNIQGEKLYELSVSFNPENLDLDYAYNYKEATSFFSYNSLTQDDINFSIDSI